MTKAILNRLKEIQDKISNDDPYNSYDEKDVEKNLILPILSIMGWKKYYKYKSPLKRNYGDGDYILRQYQIYGDKPDFVLMHNKSPKIIIEAKTGKLPLLEYEEANKKQLRRYFSYLPSVQLGILTNGYEWWFFLNRNKPSWGIKKFCDLKIKESLIDDIYEQFMNFLYYEEVITGKAIKNAKKCVGKNCIDNSVMGINDEKLMNKIDKLTSRELNPKEKQELLDLKYEAYEREIIDYEDI